MYFSTNYVGKEQFEKNRLSKSFVARPNMNEIYHCALVANNNDWMTHQHSVSGASPGWTEQYPSQQSAHHLAAHSQPQPNLAQWMQDRQRAFEEFSQSLQPLTKSADPFFDTTVTAPPSLLRHDPLFWNTRRPRSLISDR